MSRVKSCQPIYIVIQPLVVTSPSQYTLNQTHTVTVALQTTNALRRNNRFPADIILLTRVTTLGLGGSSALLKAGSGKELATCVDMTTSRPCTIE